MKGSNSGNHIIILIIPLHTTLYMKRVQRDGERGKLTMVGHRRGEFLANLTKCQAQKEKEHSKHKHYHGQNRNQERIYSRNNSRSFVAD